MPKINAPTVAEHHARQRRALLAAAADILETDGVAALTPATVGRRAGLARSSVYQYFASGAELLASVVEEAFPPANATLDAALSGVDDPRERIDVYVVTTLRLGAEGAHRISGALTAAELPGPCLDRLRELHDEQSRPLVEAVAALGGDEPGLTAQLVGGLIQAALQQIEAGRPLDVVVGRTLELVRNGLGP